MLPQALEMRVIRLEEQLYFVEERAKGADREIAAQQTQIETLQKATQQLRERVAALEAEIGAGGKNAELPPHHLPERW